MNVCLQVLYGIMIGGETLRKQLMLGNKALARGLYEAGVRVASSYPGTPSTEITEELSRYAEVYCEWAPNEKVAMEVAFGASLGGARSFCAMKHVGLNVAADPLFTMSYTGINAGMVIVVADDAGMHSSQNEQDSRYYARAAKLPMLEPSDSAEAISFAKLAFELSEQFDCPVIIKMCTRIAHSQSVVELSEREEKELKPYVKDISKYVMVPGNARKRHPLVEQRMAAIAELAETSFVNRVELADTRLGIITSSTAYQYAKEVFGQEASVLKLGMTYPLPRRLILDFASRVDELVVIEELEPLIENYCKELGLSVRGKDVLPVCGEYSQKQIAEAFGRNTDQGITIETKLPTRPPIMCAGCPHRGLFYVLAKNHCTVLGDIGCYTLGAAEPLLAVDTCICMGASISSLHGYNKARQGTDDRNTVCVIGDSTFMHSGMTSLADIAYNQSDSTIIILDNSITGMTGHQDNPTTGYDIKGNPAGRIDLEALCRAMGFLRVEVVDPYQLSECERVLRQELAAKAPSVIISRRPCSLLKYVEQKPPLMVDRDACAGCGACMKLGCPALCIKEGKAKIDSTQCVGCGMCSQLCRFQALKGGEP